MLGDNRRFLLCDRRPASWAAFSYPEPFLRAVRRGALAKSITGYHKNMVRKQCPVLELANQMPVRNMDLARAPRRTARKKGSGYENAWAGDFHYCSSSAMFVIFMIRREFQAVRGFV